MRRHAIAWACAALVLAPAAARSQTRSIYSNLANPAIGFNALFTGEIAPDIDRPYGLRFDSAEISLISFVDQYWTLSGNITVTGSEVDPEEIWARTNRIPGVQLTVGKLRGTFGKHGLLHTHAFPFIQAPVIMANTIGEEGFKDAGAEASWLTPLPWYAEVTGGIYQAIDADAEHPLDFGSTSHGNIPFLGHFKNVFDLSDETTMEVGASYLQGRGSDDHGHSAFGADLTFRNVPLRNSNRRGWILQAEYIQKGSRVGGTYHEEQHGGYASLQYRLSQVWWTGLRAEQARNSFTDVLVDNAGDPVAGKITRGSANVAWAPSEFSYVRLEYSFAQAEGEGYRPHDQRLMVEMSYTIGFHPSHAY